MDYAPVSSDATHSSQKEPSRTHHSTSDLAGAEVREQGSCPSFPEVSVSTDAERVTTSCYRGLCLLPAMEEWLELGENILNPHGGLYTYPY